MCGICGAALRNPEQDLAGRVARMNAALAHRGPDSEGQRSLGQVSLAVRRLAIIDLDTGDQPISNENGAVWVVLNGEIYNYREIAHELRAKGHRFSTRSDTEVLAHAYEEYGISMVERLRGMFAFALHDSARSCLYLARDRFGEKPLFYRQWDGGLIFSSELKSLLEWPGLERQLDLEAFGYYLRFGYVPDPLTLFSGIAQLPAGHTLKSSASGIEVRRYYAPEYRPDPALEDEETAVPAVRAALTNAVRRQMVSDVPLGAFLSGGVDSSTVVALMQSESSEPVKTFTVRFEEATYDESPIAKAVARHLGTDHHELTISNAGFTAEDLWRIVDHCGMPFADSSAIPTFIISKQVRQHVKVCLTGDGGDEMFAGYDEFSWARQVDRLARAPGALLAGGSAAAALFGRLPGARSSSALRRAQRALQAARQPAALRMPMIKSLFLPQELGRLVVDPSVLATSCGDLPRVSSEAPEAHAWTPLRRSMHYMLRNSLPQDMLTKIDRMSMANSLELRAPMLDPDLASLTMSLPDRMLINGGVRKWVLRQVARPLLPPEVFTHPKTGFSIPLHRFQNREFVTLATELLESTDGPIALLDRRAVEAVRRRGIARSHDRADMSVYRATHQLWALMQLAAWGQRFRVSV